MTNSRNILDLTPDAQAYFWRFKSHAEGKGFRWLKDWTVTSTFRDQEFQDKIYAQGRTSPGKIVTWTRHSRHSSRRAWDFCMLKYGIPQWDVAKVDVNEDQIPDYQEMAAVARELGLNVGADYGDYCHIELPEVVG